MESTRTAAPSMRRDRRSWIAVPAGRLASEPAVAASSLALVALHVVDDNFLQPQPGTSAGDHLVSGLVPLGVLAAVGASGRPPR